MHAVIGKSPSTTRPDAVHTGAPSVLVLFPATDIVKELTRMGAHVVQLPMSNSDLHPLRGSGQLALSAIVEHELCDAVFVNITDKSLGSGPPDKLDPLWPVMQYVLMNGKPLVIATSACERWHRFPPFSRACMEGKLH
eukprot:6488160-Amphidinium_carterae.1